MNAKKIMGAVLVALLAVALFVGAGAAVSGTVFVYENVSGLEGTWTGPNGQTITAIPSGAGGYFAGDNIAEGTYENESEAKITVKYPTATITGVAADCYMFIGSTLYKGDSVDLNVQSANSVDVKALLFTYTNGTAIQMSEADVEKALKNASVGEYKIQPLFNTSKFVNGTPANYFIGKPVVIKVAEADDATLVASVDSMIKGQQFTVTITGKPGEEYQLKFDNYAFSAPAGQLNLVNQGNSWIKVNMPNTATVTLTVKSNASAVGTEETIDLEWYNGSAFVETDASIDVAFVKGAISAEADAASYFIGDVVTITGTTTAGHIAYANLTGTNVKLTSGVVDIANVTYEGDAPETFEFEINTADLKKDGKKMLDVGTYTLTLETESGVKATVALVLKQPFISILEAPEVVVQGTEAEFFINAEATKNVKAYFFGTNFFKVVDGKLEDKDVTNKFVVTLEDTDTEADVMAAGQYFVVFQHPMYDTVFNINATTAGAFWLNTQGAASESHNTNIFNYDGRQTANAAQALCDALDSQNIDDMYVKYSFFVVGEDESFTISEIPTTVTQGETITISGVDTANAEKTVTVEMISTAFAAVPKETVGSAAFILVTADIAEDGTWEVTLDTSDLNVDEYSLSVVIDDATKKNVKVNVIEGADTPDTPDTPDVPDTPDTPDTPTEPTTPGFGALAALAGLGAVAVLLLRRE